MNTPIHKGCPECKTFLLSTENYCRKCGSKAQKIPFDYMCKKCGAGFVNEGFCSKCGEKLIKTSDND